MAKTTWNIVATYEGRVTTNEVHGKLLAEFKTDMWTRIWFRSDKFPCQENKKYKISIDACPGNTKVKYLVNWYDATGYRKYRSYITSSRILTARGVERA